MPPLGRRGADEFFDLFERAAANAERAAGLLVEMIDSYPERADLAREILRCENEGDSITHTVIRKLADATRPPIPKSAAHRLATALDDVVDYTEQIADSFNLYKIEAPMDQALQLAQVLAESCGQLRVAVGTLRGGNSMSEAIIEVHRLENEGDRISRDAIASLFEGGVDPMVVIRWKDIFEHLEHAIDASEDVAHALEGGSLGG
ncbi:MAG: DUF47 family protein [Thermoleophilia bacterium]|nr:DUF47 family protein [Thermoleophilia bacterium]